MQHEQLGKRQPSQPFIPMKEEYDTLALIQPRLKRVDRLSTSSSSLTQGKVNGISEWLQGRIQFKVY